ARLFFERALDLDPNSAEAYAMLGHLSLQTGDTTNAEERFRVGRRVELDDPMILFQLGNVYIPRRDATTAAQYHAVAVVRKVDDASFGTAFGQALFDQGAYGLAEKVFEKALTLRPDLNLAKLYLARSRMRQYKIDAARPLFAELVADQQ